MSLMRSPVKSLMRSLMNHWKLAVQPDYRGCVEILVMMSWMRSLVSLVVMSLLMSLMTSLVMSLIVSWMRSSAKSLVELVLW